MTTQCPTLLERLGGQPAVTAAVDSLYIRILADPSLSEFFRQSEIDSVKRHQRAFLMQLLGAHTNGSGARMRDAHKSYAIEIHHFHAVATHLTETLRSLEVPDGVVQEVLAKLGPLMNDIVNTPAQAG